MRPVPRPPQTEMPHSRSARRAQTGRGRIRVSAQIQQAACCHHRQVVIVDSVPHSVASERRYGHVNETRIDGHQVCSGQVQALGIDARIRLDNDVRRSNEPLEQGATVGHTKIQRDGSLPCVDEAIKRADSVLRGPSGLIWPIRADDQRARVAGSRTAPGFDPDHVRPEIREETGRICCKLVGEIEDADPSERPGWLPQVIDHPGT